MKLWMLNSHQDTKSRKMIKKEKCTHPHNKKPKQSNEY